MLYIASDHAGFELKEYLKQSLAKRGLKIKDFGARIYNKEDDYPDFIIPLAKTVGKNPTRNRGIILGGSGQGEQIAANKIRGVRAALYYGGPIDIVTLSKTHNNTNILSLGARFLNKKEALRAVLLWIGTSFANVTRHKRRIKKIDEFTKQ
ncbi:RpiB/LacA/LacB family sugar-phosphate isomerase [Candidatus Uhrbacteria bacterium]|nr:RpiB/LacA/LacB family sugar-phosphate isomerase [Candidatus Uhrbacteria bacterium]